ncbi:hypothetical protein P167DRAFT_574516 [Morchella conica CCBAS932]|uniref:Uncharacterized protein n=1 Tax=Morchella conica CCBAS932 TaxID=1392247 RepID=A0A3N4KNM8_9PEZI|nr:hypothetical protein P167DRAFT_574516 [Morchella conica CCBAS932]
MPRPHASPCSRCSNATVPAELQNPSTTEPQYPTTSQTTNQKPNPAHHAQAPASDPSPTRCYSVTHSNPT